MPNIYDRLESWLDDALDHWAAVGVDRVNGGFVEHLLLDGSNPDVEFKRLRVLCRQIYVYSHAAVLRRPGSLDIARHGYRFLTSHGWLGPERGWARQLGRAGGVIDPTPDLYDLAFVLFALGWYYRATGDDDALLRARETVAFLDRHMRHPMGGYLAEKPSHGHRLQNPHMHLLEAALVHVENTGEPVFRALADEIVMLFRTRFFDPATETLAEYFDENWMRAAGDPGRMTEPGHQFEWAWILSNYQRLTGEDVGNFAVALVRSGERFGVDPVTGVTFDVVRDDGVVLDRGSRAWTNAERLQAAVAMFEMEGRDPSAVFVASGGLLLDRYLANVPRGTWIDHFDGAGQPKVNKIPASSLYHFTIAFTEVLRVRKAVELQFQAA